MLLMAEIRFDPEKGIWAEEVETAEKLKAVVQRENLYLLVID